MTWTITTFCRHPEFINFQNSISALGVATGIFGSQSLKKVSDSVLEDFQDLEKSFEILKSTKLRSDYKSFDYDFYCNIAADSRE